MGETCQQSHLGHSQFMFSGALCTGQRHIWRLQKIRNQKNLTDEVPRLSPESALEHLQLQDTLVPRWSQFIGTDKGLPRGGSEGLTTMSPQRPS